MIERQMLSWQCRNQKAIRADLYCGVFGEITYHDFRAEGSTSFYAMLIAIMLPSMQVTLQIVREERSSRRPALQEGPIYMQQRLQDAMAIVRNNGKPSFFITFTCNPPWPQITRELLSGQDAKYK